ncbi:hypothetical protein ACFX2A_015319 [Malus domestica]
MEAFAHGLADGQIVRNYMHLQSDRELHECLDNCEDLKIFARAKGVLELLLVGVPAPEAIKVLRRYAYYGGLRRAGFAQILGYPRG